MIALEEQVSSQIQRGIAIRSSDQGIISLETIQEVATIIYDDYTSQAVANALLFNPDRLAQLFFDINEVRISGLTLISIVGVIARADFMT